MWPACLYGQVSEATLRCAGAAARAAAGGPAGGGAGPGGPVEAEAALLQKTPAGLQISYVVVPVDQKLSQLVRPCVHAPMQPV